MTEINQTLADFMEVYAVKSAELKSVTEELENTRLGAEAVEESLERRLAQRQADNEALDARLQKAKMANESLNLELATVRDKNTRLEGLLAKERHWMTKIADFAAAGEAPEETINLICKVLINEAGMDLGQSEEETVDE